MAVVDPIGDKWYNKPFKLYVPSRYYHIGMVIIGFFFVSFGITAGFYLLNLPHDPIIQPQSQPYGVGLPDPRPFVLPGLIIFAPLFGVLFGLYCMLSSWRKWEYKAPPIDIFANKIKK